MTSQELKNKLNLGSVPSTLNSELAIVAGMITGDEEVGYGAIASMNGREGVGLLVATNKRVIYACKFAFNSTNLEFYYDKISNIEFEIGILRKVLTIVSLGSIFQFKGLLGAKEKGKVMIDYISAQIDNSRRPNNTVPKASAAINPIDQIEQLAALKEKGIITEDEFAAKKKQLLGL
jgi:hypothetical protein